MEFADKFGKRLEVGQKVLVRIGGSDIHKTGTVTEVGQWNTNFKTDEGYAYMRPNCEFSILNSGN